MYMTMCGQISVLKFLYKIISRKIKLNLIHIFWNIF